MIHHGLPLNGWLCLDKPVGLTSTQALGRARRLLGAGKAGHGGTLDPLASGILPIAFGEATKTVAYVMDAVKVYRFSVRWGEARTTDDAEGEVTATSSLRPDCAAIESILPHFVGEITQTPPAFSALKVAGERAYDLARKGEDVALTPRTVRIDALTCLNGVDTFEVTCGKGTYVRSLARDMARALGTVGHVSTLRRLRVGRFDLSRAVTLDDLDARRERGEPLSACLLPLERALEDLPRVVLDAADAATLSHGQSVTLHPPLPPPQTPLAVFSGERLLAIGEVVDGKLHTLRGINL